MTTGEYSLLGVYEIKDKSGNRVRLVKLLNPSGSDSYTGPWNDKDENWTPALRKQVGMSDKNDGIFTMPIGIFRKTHRKVRVTYSIEDVKMDRIKKHVQQSGEHVSTYAFENPTKQDVILMLELPNKRQFVNGCPGYRAIYNVKVYEK